MQSTIRGQTLILIFILTITGCNNNEKVKNEEFIKECILRIENQNETARKNLDQINWFFDTFKIIDSATFEQDWIQARELQRASNIIQEDIETLKESITSESQTIKPKDIAQKINDYKKTIAILTDTTKGSIYLSLEFSQLKKESWNLNKELERLNLTIIQTALVNAQTVVLMRLFHNMFGKIEKIKMSTTGLLTL